MKQSFEDRLIQEEELRLKRQAEKLKPGPEREAMERKGRQIDKALRWVLSTELRPPQ